MVLFGWRFVGHQFHDGTRRVFDECSGGTEAFSDALSFVAVFK